jgi:hypothetical protein
MTRESYADYNKENDPLMIRRLEIRETAQEIMATMLGNCSIDKTKARENGDMEKLIDLEKQTTELIVVRDNIYSGDPAAIDYAFHDLGAVVKARFLAEQA